MQLKSVAKQAASGYDGGIALIQALSRLVTSVYSQTNRDQARSKAQYQPVGFRDSDSFYCRHLSFPYLYVIKP
jgi:hypothetical protein